VSTTTHDWAVGLSAEHMPLVAHVRELRTRVIRAILAILAGTVTASFFYEPVIEVLVRPVCGSGIGGLGESGCPIVITDILGPLSLQLKVSLAAGLLVSSPLWLYQLWAFLAPGLHRHEKRWTYAFVASSTPLFLTGTAAAYWLLPKAVRILLGFTPGTLDNLI
jgi:sec-independent protein translocase protein TatC